MKRSWKGFFKGGGLLSAIVFISSAQASFPSQGYLGNGGGGKTLSQEITPELKSQIQQCLRYSSETNIQYQCLKMLMVECPHISCLQKNEAICSAVSIFYENQPLYSMCKQELLNDRNSNLASTEERSYSIGSLYDSASDLFSQSLDYTKSLWNNITQKIGN